MASQQALRKRLRQNGRAKNATAAIERTVEIRAGKSLRRARNAEQTGNRQATAPDRAAVPESDGEFPARWLDRAPNATGRGCTDFPAARRARWSEPAQKPFRRT